MPGESPETASVETLLVAIGNPLRGDDGVACALAERVAARHHAFGAPLGVLAAHQLCPEHAAVVSHYATVILIDADPTAACPFLEPLRPSGSQALSHSLSSAALLLLAGTLFGWHGQAWLCHLPARDFSPGGPLTATAEGSLPEAATMIEKLLARLRVEGLGAIR